jgi:predicted RNA methylase
MAKMTRKERQTQLRIAQWLAGEIELDPSIAIHGYIPEGLDVINAFYTPQENAEIVANEVLETSPYKVADLCAGTGALLYELKDHVDELFAFEIDPKAYEIGMKAVPSAEWNLGDTFENANLHDMSFDVVAMNPPFGGIITDPYRDMTGKSEYMFLELASFHCERIVTIGGEMFLDGMPSDTRTLLEEKWMLTKIEKLPEKHKHTNINTFMYVFEKGVGVWARMPEKKVEKVEYEDPKTIAERILADLDESRKHIQELIDML